MLRSRILAVAALAAASILAASPAVEAVAQVYPTNNPTYIPTAVLPATTLAAPGDVTFNTNGLGTVVFRIAGTNTGVAGTFQVTESRAASPTWQTVGVTQVGGTGGSISAVTGNGVYRLKAAGFAQVRFHMTAISTGSAVVSGAGGPAADMLLTSPLRRATYSAAITALAPASSATDFFTLTGSATTTVRVNRVECSGISTAAATASIEALRRSTADTGGTATNPTATPHDANDPAATAVVAAYTANPTVGTLVGSLRAGKLTTNTAASSAFGTSSLVWNFGDGQNEEVTLRGAAQQFALNGVGASFSSGTALQCAVTWTEE